MATLRFIDKNKRYFSKNWRETRINCLCFKSLTFFLVGLVALITMAGSVLAAENDNVEHLTFEHTYDLNESIAKGLGIPAGRRTIKIQVLYPKGLSDSEFTDDSKDSYPVLLWSSSMSYFPAQNTALAKTLVNNGFVVAAIAHNGTNWIMMNPLNYTNQCKVVRKMNSGMAVMVEDASATIDGLENQNSAKFNNKLDFSRIGYMGYSIAGAAAFLSLQKDNRIMAAINLDGANHPDVLRSGPGKPWFFMTTQKSFEKDITSEGCYEFNYPEQTDKMFAKTDEGYAFSIEDSNHGDFMNLCMDNSLWRFMFGSELCGNVPYKKVNEILGEYSVAFFNKHLNGTIEPILDSPKYPELYIFRTR